MRQSSGKTPPRLLPVPAGRSHLNRRKEWVDGRFRRKSPRERSDGGAGRDGALRADVYSPVSGGGYPVLLQRTPYDKASESNAATARDLAARGYVVAVQDIRGRYASEGDFIWQFQDGADTFDAQDGYDAVEWAARLPGSDGQVGTWGHSYPSWCIWQLAGAAPPHLGALFASGMASRILDLNFGVFETGRRLQWTYNMAVDARRRAGDDRGPSTRAEADLQWHEVERGKWIWRLPLVDIPDHVFSTLGPMLKRYMREQNKEFWAFDRIHSRVEVPTCQVTGWYDRLIGTIDNFAGMVANGPAAPPRPASDHDRPVGTRQRRLRAAPGPARLRPGGGHDLRGRGRAMVRLPVQGRRHRSRLRASGEAVRDEREQVAVRGAVAPGRHRGDRVVPAQRRTRQLGRRGRSPVCV